MNDFVVIFEVAPRDGLQNERMWVSTEDKIVLIDRLSECGFCKIEATSFVSPKWIPQMQDAGKVMRGIRRKKNVHYSTLTPNGRGFDAALQANTDEVAVFASASEAFSQKNINCSIEESLERFTLVMEKAQRHHVPVRGYVSCITHCPYQGAIAPPEVSYVAEQLFRLGCYEVSLGDTIGFATPEDTAMLLEHLENHVNFGKIAGHFHDTKSRAIDNIDVCLAYRIHTFDSAIGGLGGCPYAPGSKGNVATEKLVSHLHHQGFKTGIDEQKLQNLVPFAQSLRKKNQ